MESFRTKAFRKLYNELPDFVRQKAQSNYKKWIQNPYNSEIKFENIYKNFWSASIGYSYRAIGKMVENNIIVWFGIGTHEDYNQIIKQLKNLAKGKIN